MQEPQALAGGYRGLSGSCQALENCEGSDPVHEGPSRALFDGIVEANRPGVIKSVASAWGYEPERRRPEMMLILIIVLVVLIFGGGGGYYGYRRWGYGGGGGIGIGTILVILLVLYLLGFFR